MVLGAWSCKGEKIINIHSDTNLLEQPYPLYYGDPKLQNPKKNKIIKVLKVGEKGILLRIETGKDFQMYKVKMPNGMIGYIINDNKVEINNG